MFLLWAKRYCCQPTAASGSLVTWAARAIVLESEGLRTFGADD